MKNETVDRFNLSDILKGIDFLDPESRKIYFESILIDVEDELYLCNRDIQNGEGIDTEYMENLAYIRGSLTRRLKNLNDYITNF